MIPIYLKLQNFLSHKNTELSFEGISVACIQGVNGSGKSAIADGMLYALYGQTSRGKDTDLVTLGESEMSVVFDFEQSGQRFRVLRKKTGKGKNLTELYIHQSDGTLVPVASGETAKERIVSELHRDFQTFVSSSFLLQGQGERLISAKPSERYKVVFDILGLDKYQDYRKKAAVVRNMSEGRIEALSIQAADLTTQADGLAAVEAQLLGYTESLEKLRSEILVSENDLSIKKGEVSIIDARLKELTAISSKGKATLQQISELEAKNKGIVESYVSVPERLQPALELLLSKDLILKDILNLEVKLNTISLSMDRSTSKIRERENRLKEKSAVCLAADAAANDLARITLELKGKRASLDSVAEDLSVLSAEAQKKAAVELAISKLQGDIATAVQQRSFTLKTAQGKLTEAQKKAALLQQAACGGQGDYAACSFIVDSVQAKNTLPQLVLEVANLEVPFESPLQKELELLIAQLQHFKIEETKLADIQSLAARFKSEIAVLEEKISELTRVAAQKDQMITVENELCRLTEELNGLIQEMSEVSLLNRGQENTLTSIHDEVAVLSAVRDRLIKEAEVSEIGRTLIAARQVLSEISDAVKTYAELEVLVQSVNVEIIQLQGKIKSLKEQESLLSSAWHKANAAADICRMATSKLVSLKADLAAGAEQIKVYSLLEDAYDRIPFFILDNVIGLMEDEANKVLAEISSTGMRIELKTEKISKTTKNIKDALEIVVSDISGERPIEMYSGGEKTRQILALAVGMAELSARKAGVKINTMLIDEPAGLDRQGLADFGRCFIKLVESGVFKKGFLMAHEESLKDVFDQKILVTKDGTVSKVEVLM